MPRPALPLAVSSEDRLALDRLIRAASTPQRTAQRARMVFMAGEGVTVGETAHILGVWRKGVTRQRARWTQQSHEPVLTRLGDAPRSGKPPTFTAEQTCAILALACEAPEASGLPLSHWSAPDLAREAIKRRLVANISPRSVGRFLK
jgi:putative transposase